MKVYSTDIGEVMSILDKIIEFKNLVPENYLDELYNYANNVGSWKLQYSHPKYKKQRFLLMPLMRESLRRREDSMLTNMVSALEEKVDKKFAINRIYFNGQFFGMPGCPHIDSGSTNKYTFLLYLNPEWDLTWGGQTIFYDKSFDEETGETTTHSENYKVYYPQKNLSLFFPATIFHYAECPTKNCSELRITLAFKLEVLS